MLLCYLKKKKLSKINYISSFVTINNNQIAINGKIDFSNNEQLPASDFLKSAYKHYNINYPKFYKMDGLCKLGFLASELLIKSNPVTQKYTKEDIAIILSNSSSSLDIDSEHQLTIQDKTNFFPSPAIFVYTLSNIVIGEIAIRNHIQGENSFFIFDKFDTEFNVSYIESILKTNKAKCCIAGWVDFYENNMNAFMFIVESTTEKNSLQFTVEELNKLYN